MKRIKNLYLVYLGFIFVNVSNAAVPDAKIIGPITADPIGDPSRNFIYSASAIDLAFQGYIEEEYLIEGDEYCGLCSKKCHALPVLILIATQNLNQITRIV